MSRKRRNRQERIKRGITQGSASTNIDPKSADIERQITEAWKLAVKNNQSEVTFITPIHNIQHLESAVNRIIPNPMFEGWYAQGFADSGICGIVLDNGTKGSKTGAEMVRDSPQAHQKSILAKC